MKRDEIGRQPFDIHQLAYVPRLHVKVDSFERNFVHDLDETFSILKGVFIAW